MTTQAQTNRGVRLIDLSDWPGFEVRESGPGREVLVSEPIEPGLAWTEMVPSWNVDGAPGTGVTLEARAFVAGAPTKFYVLARWSPDGKAPRESVKAQGDANGDVDTDTWRLKTPGAAIELRLTLNAPPNVRIPKVKLLTLCLRDTAASPEALPAMPSVWGKVLDVPLRSQMSYPGGNVLCSPTAVSMLLAYWSQDLGQPRLDRDVPEVQRGVFDPNWPGTGNWPFNTAYAGALPGMRAYVARFTDVAELEAWIACGKPVATSVSYDLLRGKGKKGANDGHLVVMVGFDEHGDPVFNDPGRATEVRQTYKRADFEAAWLTSGRTVYLIYPKLGIVPEDPFGHWIPNVQGA